MDEPAKSAMKEIAISQYANAPCRICGKTLTREDINSAVFAGYSADNSSRAAHKECWDKKVPADQWAHK